ncbi:TetR/AcrR family transcriptional regulator [Streptomyces sp. NBC_00654]|uniref:TetR/AcrR family transcriptional regulator n=1 Tax=Streptomyces sp. NBC_00654 TaxID=2975799 RepID=UPI00225B3EC6|nr:TetR/AcrR family transcriptional regulator [Streptomyces sp. NBC_00654]MCX4966477.1 TetR/AcrR family transcriptional regulator [Streptomyces sp. NBC_00654]
MAGTAATPRERYREQVRAEVKQLAWEQIAGAGASALSLNAIAKRMGMSGPALYRYFAGRDELITALIRDAYRSLAGTVRNADPRDLPGLARALRGWALEDPQRYFLVYGTPVPGYHAPQDVTAISSEIMSVLLDACVAAGPEGAPAAAAGAPPGPPAAAAGNLDVYLEEHRHWASGHPAARPAELRRALSFWTRLHGLLSLELAGHFTGMDLDVELLFAAELDALLPG